MTRETTPAVDAALASGQMVIGLLAFMDMPSGVLRLSNLPFDVQWTDPYNAGGPHTWKGLAGFGSASAPEEGTALQDYEIVLRMSGIPEEYWAITLNEAYMNRTARVWLALLDSDHQVIPDPVLLFAGRMDAPEVIIGGEGEQGAVVNLPATSRLADWETSRDLRYTNAAQQAIFPGDKGLEFVNETVEKEIPWGKA